MCIRDRGLRHRHPQDRRRRRRRAHVGPAGAEPRQGRTADGCVRHDACRGRPGMTRQLVISPDVNVRNITDWFILNTKVQRMTGEAFHATAYTDFADLHKAYADGQADLVFANAADTAMLVRDHGYLPIAAASGVSKEASVVVAADGPMHAP